MGRLAIMVVAFAAERVRMICLALALVAAAKLTGALILDRLTGPQDAAAEKSVSIPRPSSQALQ